MRKEIVVSGLQCPSGIAVDAAKGELYWSDLADRTLGVGFLIGFRVWGSFQASVRGSGFRVP